jgi:hypothetical protein
MKQVCYDPIFLTIPSRSTPTRSPAESGTDALEDEAVKHRSDALNLTRPARTDAAPSYGRCGLARRIA